MQNFERENLEVLKLENITFCYFFFIPKTKKYVIVTMLELVEHAFSHALFLLTYT
jgi:hypothetical protein